MARANRILMVTLKKLPADAHAAGLRAEGFDLTMIENNGLSVLDAIDAFLPDIVLMYPDMDALNAVAVIEQVRLHSAKHMPVCQPVFLILSGDPNQRDIFQRPYQSYFRLLPVTPEVLLHTIRQITEDLESERKSQPQSGPRLDSLLTDIGMPCHLKGRELLHTSAIFYAQNPIPEHEFTTKLYPLVAIVHGCKASNVERNIRNALQVTMDRGNSERIYAYFGTRYGLTNGFAISRLAELVRAWRGALPLDPAIF